MLPRSSKDGRIPQSDAQLAGDLVRFVVLERHHLALHRPAQPGKTGEGGIVERMLTPVRHPEQTPRDTRVFGLFAEARVRQHGACRRSSYQSGLAVTVRAAGTLRLEREPDAHQCQVELGGRPSPWPVHSRGRALLDEQHRQRFFGLVQFLQAVMLCESQLSPITSRCPCGQLDQAGRSHDALLVVADESPVDEPHRKPRRLVSFRTELIRQRPPCIPRVLDRLSGQEGGVGRRGVDAKDSRALDAFVLEQLRDVARRATPVDIDRFPHPGFHARLSLRAPPH